ncbi:MATE family efflux transporter [Sutterella sp.]|uniref:MATE family efflux transporter n=1 Tax=Sutterella sp. TaxID=1981025 RepID=UPI0026E0E0FF|nr:MATE family efflux transporter [Sutterella sp.]MDO5532795.1 MATE family efflux transporter [Sutterella sp.]
MTTPTHLAPPDISLRAMLRLAGPIFIANIAIIGSGTIDTIMGGQLGREHLAAIALGISATISVLMGLVGILQGLSPVAGHHFGARKFGDIGIDAGQSLWLVLCFSMIGVPLLMATDFWIELGGASGEVARMASQYMFWTALALPGSMAARVYISLNAAVSRPRVTMYVSLAMLALKVPLNAVFMYGFLGCPAMGGAGAGVSFFVLTYLSLIAYWVIWRRDPYYRAMHAPGFVMPEAKRLWNLLKIGVPMGLCTFFEVSSFTLMAIFVSRLGPTIISAHQIVANLTSMCYMIPLSIGIATSVLISQSLGARWPGVAYACLKRTLRVMVTIAVIVSVALYLFRDAVVWLYTGEAQVHDLATALLLFGCLYHVFDALQSVSGFALRGYRVTFAPMIIFGVMLWGVGLGLGYQFAFGAEWAGGPYGVYGFWGSTSVGLLLTGVSLTAMAIWVGRQFAKDDRHTPEEIASASGLKL